MPPERLPLASVQAAILARITGQDLGTGASDVARLIRGDARAGAEARVAVYAYMYRARVVEALESQFPRLARLVGADDCKAFVDLAAAYIDAHPSRQPSLRGLGQHLPAWLAAARPERPALVALATLEWARTDLFDLADDAVMTLDDLRATPPDRFGELAVRAIAAHRLLGVPGGTGALWDALDPAAPELPPVAALAVTETGGGESLLVWRQGTAVYHRLLEEAERSALAAMAEGTRFGVICDQLLAQGGDEGAAAAQAFQWLSTWVADGLLAPAA